MGKYSFQNIQKILFFAIVGVLNGSAMTACGTLISSIAVELNYSKLGVMSLLINNFAAALFTFIAPAVVSRLPYRVVFFMTCTTCTFFLMEGVLMSSCKGSRRTEDFYCQDGFMYTICGLMSVVFGFGSPVMTVASSMYISQNTDESNKGLYFGLVSTIGQSSILIGNIMGTLLVPPLGEFWFFVLMCIIAMTSAVVYLVFLKNPGEKVYSELELLELAELKQFQGQPVLQQIKEVGICIGRPNLRHMLSYMFQAGFIPGIEAGGLSELVQRVVYRQHPSWTPKINGATVESMISRIGMIVGIFEIAGGQAVAWISDQVQKRNFARFNNLTYQIGIFGAILLLTTGNYQTAYFIAPFWGFTDCVGQTLNFALISERFGDDLQAFSVYALLNNIGTSVAMAIALFYNENVGYTICIYFGVVMIQQVITNYTLTLLRPKNEYAQLILEKSKQENAQLEFSVNHDKHDKMN